MSETPDISMDLLELEDAAPPPDIGSTVDAYKWTLVRHLDEVFRFKLLKRHFQFQLYITHDSTWQRVSYSSTIEEELNRFQERTRLARYCLRLKLNPGITPTNCGRP